jgi:3-dehydroquinate synthase
MEKLLITIPSAPKREYPICIGNHLIEKLASLFDLSKYSKLFIITDQIVEPLFLEKLVNNLPDKTAYISLPPGEQAKNIESVTKIWTAMHDAGLDRKALVINLGGGVIGDMGAFAASTYMRGIDFLNIPTTLLAQVDESVGGKTGIDFAAIKNLIGTFNQPIGVIIDMQTLRTLPKREFLASFVEIIKHGLIKDKKYFNKVISKHPLDFTEDELIDIIKESCEIKAYFVQSDEKESGKRKIVNFGHTIGHAIEAIKLETDQPLLHGEAIAIGIVAESEIAREMGLLSLEETARVKQSLQQADLPITISGLSTDEIFKKMQSDKKNAFNKINFTLLKGIGDALYNQHVSKENIIAAIKKIQS